MKKQILSMLFLMGSVTLFGINGLLVKTIDYSFQEKWYNTISTTAPRIINCDTIFKGQRFFVRVLELSHPCALHAKSREG